MATEQNLLYGAGGWGFSLLILAVLVLVGVVVARGEAIHFLRFPVTSFVPLGFLLAYLRDLPFRVGAGDSLNRLWIHIVPLAMLFVVAAFGTINGKVPFRSLLSKGRKQLRVARGPNSSYANE
jgi:hypothetical protein